MINNTEYEGLRMLDFESMILAQWTMCLKRLIEAYYYASSWKIFLSNYLEKVGGNMTFIYSQSFKRRKVHFAVPSCSFTKTLGCIVHSHRQGRVFSLRYSEKSSCWTVSFHWYSFQAPIKGEMSDISSISKILIESSVPVNRFLRPLKLN